MRKYNPVLALLFSAWFLLFSWFWTYGAALVIAYPSGVIGFFLWRASDNGSLRKLAGWCLVLGLIASLISLTLMLIYN